MIEQERYVITSKQLNALRLELSPEIIIDLKKVTLSAELQKERERVLDDAFELLMEKRFETELSSSYIVWSADVEDIIESLRRKVE